MNRATLHTRQVSMAFAPSLLVLLVSCGGGEAADPVFAVRDSAGVEIVESVAPAWREGEAWSVGPEPLLRIGVLAGDPAYQFSDITGAVRLDDGTLVVADGGSQQVRFFGPDGVFLRSVGRAGSGPGEFEVLAGLGHVPGGGVWAYDFSTRRVTWLSAAGEVVRLTTLDPEPPTLSAVGALPDGSFALRQLWGARQVAEATTTGLRRNPVAYVRFDAAGALLDTVGLFPGREVYLTEEGGRGVMNTPPFARNSSGALRAGRVVVGSQQTFELTEHAPDGTLLRRLKVTGSPLDLRPGEIEGFIEDRVADAPPGERAGLRSRLASMPVPPTRPAYGDVLADAPGDLWVAEWVPFPRLPEVWTVLDPGGRWLGSVRLPAGFYPLDIGEDWILALERDALDVEYIVLLRLEKPVPRVSASGSSP